MKIDITNSEFALIIKALETASYIYGPMSDCVDKKYKKVINELESIERKLLISATEFGFAQTELVDGERVVKEEYGSRVLDDLAEYDDWQLYENLANKLAWRDFHNKYSREQINAMQKESKGYLGVQLYDFEKKYWDEFDKYEYDRLFVVKE